MPGSIADRAFDEDAPWFAVAMAGIDLTVNLEGDRVSVRGYYGVEIDVALADGRWEAHLLAGMLRLAHGLGMLKLSVI